MAFCNKCGAQLTEGSAFCSICGSKVELPTKPAQPVQQAAQQVKQAAQPVQQAVQQAARPVQQQPVQQAQPEHKPDLNDLGNEIGAKVAEITNTADTTNEYDAKDISSNKVFAVFAYLWILVLVPIFGAPNSKFAKFHANQGLILAILETAWWIISALLRLLFNLISWRLGVVIAIITGILNIPFIALTILGIVNVADGKAKELPIIGKYRILK